MSLVNTLYTDTDTEQQKNGSNKSNESIVVLEWAMRMLRLVGSISENF